MTTDLEHHQIPAGTPTMYLDTLAHDLLLAEIHHRRHPEPSSSIPYWNRATLAYVYGQATRWFSDREVPIGAGHLETVANAVERLDACACCLFTGGGHETSCPVPF
jgi:hypothetical protein